MKTKNTIVLIVAMILIAPLLGYGQDMKAISKALTKSMGSVGKAGVDIPGFSFGINPSTLTGSAGELSDAVESAVGGAMKAGKKSPLFSLDNLNPDQLTKLASSESPFSSLMEMKGPNARADFENIISDQLDKTGAMNLLDNASNIPGFSLGEGKDMFVKQISDNTISALDKSGAKMIEKFVK